MTLYRSLRAHTFIMHPTEVPSLLLVCAAALAFGCERQHDATPTVRAFLEAVQYDDRDGAFALHIDSTSASAWCSAQFRNVLEKAQSSAAGDDCARVLGLDADELNALPDEVRLAVQISGWACGHRDGSCADYAETVFAQSWGEQPTVASRPAGYEVRRVFGEDDRAVAYVDFVFDDGSREHRTIELSRIDEGWRVSDGFLEGPK